MKLKYNLNNLTYVPSAKIGRKTLDYKSKTSFSPKKLYVFFKMYAQGRKTKNPFLKILDDVRSAIFKNCRLRIFENKNNEMLAGYTYKLRKNKLDEKSMYIDGLARNMSADLNNNSKKIMTSVFEDIKKTAIEKKRKELTLFVYTQDRNLRRHYEQLGFKLDLKNDIKKLYLMRVRVDSFLNTAYFKLRKYKEALGIENILSTKNGRGGRFEPARNTLD